MLHAMRWTPLKIQQRLGLIGPLVYRRALPLSEIRYTTLASSKEAPLIGADLDDRGWDVIEPNTYWGAWRTNFVMRSKFAVPTEWPHDAPVALYLP